MKDVEGLSPQSAIMMGVITAMVMVLGFGAWAALLPIEGAIMADGEVDNTSQRYVIQHPQGGTVRAVDVREGQAVEAGDLLFRLDDLPLESEWALISSQLVDAQARSLRLTAERDGTRLPDTLDPARGDPQMRAAVTAQNRLFVARQQTVDRQLAQLEQRGIQIEAQLDGLNAQRRALIQEAALIDAELETQTELRARGLTQATRVAGLAREAARIEGARAAVVSRIAEARGQIIEIALQAESLLASRREEAEQQLAENNALLVELASRRTILADRRANMVLRAPVSGRVHGMTTLAPGSVLRPAETAMQIVERSENPSLALLISPSDIDHVQVGQQAQVQFPALDLGWQNLVATVTEISAAPFLNERTGERYYSAKAELTPESISQIGAQSLLPGLAVQAFLRTGARTPLAYLLAPIARQLRRAMREP